MDTTGSVDVVGTGTEQVTMDKLLEDLRRVIVGVGFVLGVLITRR
jgi:hypothetical protein